MNYGEHGYVLLDTTTSRIGRFRPPMMAIQLNADGLLAPVPELGMEQVQGCVIWRLYSGDRITVVTPEMVIGTPEEAPQAHYADNRDAWGRRLPRE